MCDFQSRPYQVGSYYHVQCVHGRLYDDIDWWPVMGEAHRDKEIIGFPHLHYHVDWRFVGEAARRRHLERSWRPANVEAHAVPLMLFPEAGRSPRRFDDAPGEIVTRIRRLKCKREALPYPHGRADWQQRIAEHYASACLKRGVCPHRGYDLSREPETDGIVTCPLHGLRWNVVTGAAVSAPIPHPPTAIAA